MTLFSQLDRLETSGLIQPMDMPELEYLFRHALVQDAAYQSLLMADRRQFHLVIGEMLEQLYPDRLDELAAELGQHFQLAQEDGRAFPYLMKAADNAAATYANEEAIAFYSKAIAIAPDIEVEEGVLPYLCQTLGRTLEIISAYGRALTHYQEMEQLALKRGDKRLELTAVMGQTTLYTTPTAVNNIDLGAVYAERAVALAKELDDQPAQLRILWNLLNLYAHKNDMEKAFAVGEKALTLANAQGMREEEAYLANDLGRHYEFVGSLRRAETLAKRARYLWRELNNLPMLADSLALSSSIACEKGVFHHAIAFSDEGAEIGASMNNLQAQAYNLIMLGPPYLYIGRVDNAYAALSTCLQYARQISFVPVQIFALAYLARMYLHCGDMNRGAAAAQAAYTLAETAFPRVWIVGISARAIAYATAGDSVNARKAIAEAKINSGYRSQALFSIWVMEAEALVLLQEGDAQSAYALLDVLRTTLEGFDNLAYMPATLLLQGEALAALGRWDEARNAAEHGRKTAINTQNLYTLWQLAAFQSRLQTQEGNPKKAELLRHEAATIITQIAANCPPDLQETFLSMPEVTAVLHPQQP